MNNAKPNAARHNPSPLYLRRLIERAGLTQAQAAKAIGISARMMRYYLAEEGSDKHREAPYRVQYALEGLAEDLGDRHANRQKDVKKEGPCTR